MFVRNFDTNSIFYLALVGHHDHRAAVAAQGRRDGCDRPRPMRTRSVIRNRGSVRRIPFEAIDWIGAAGDYAEVHGDGRVDLIEEPLASLAKRLPAGRIRAHPSRRPDPHRPGARDRADRSRRRLCATRRPASSCGSSRRFRDGLAALLGSACRPPSRRSDPAYRSPLDGADVAAGKRLTVHLRRSALDAVSHSSRSLLASRPAARDRRPAGRGPALSVAASRSALYAVRVARIDGQDRLVYELHATNFSRANADHRRARHRRRRRAARQLARVDPAGTMQQDRRAGRRRPEIWPSVSARSSSCPFPGPARGVASVSHRITFDAARADAAPDRVAIAGGRIMPAAPVRGRAWRAAARRPLDCRVHLPDVDNGHRRFPYAVSGRVRLPGRHAIDWMPARGFDPRSAGAGVAAGRLGRRRARGRRRRNRCGQGARRARRARRAWRTKQAR